MCTPMSLPHAVSPVQRTSPYHTCQYAGRHQLLVTPTKTVLCTSRGADILAAITGAASAAATLMTASGLGNSAQPPLTGPTLHPVLRMVCAAAQVRWWPSLRRPQ
jgi:hypothetical protein